MAFKKLDGAFDREFLESQLQVLQNKLKQYPDIKKFTENLCIPSEPSDDADAAFYLAQVDMSVSELNRCAIEQHAIVSAIMSIGLDLRKKMPHHYGFCQECTKAISKNRLNALPWASLCLPCQEQRERTSPLHY